jgi:hypothetical protein
LFLDVAATASSPRGHAAAVAAAAALATVAVLARNVGLAFLPGFAVWLLTAPGHPRTRRVAGALAVAAVPFASWFAVRTSLAQECSHAFGFGLGPRRGLEDLRIMLLHLDRSIAPFPLGLVLFAAIVVALAIAPAVAARRLALPVAQVQQRRIVAFVLLSLAMVWLVFRVTAINDPPGGRFVGFGAWLLAPVMLAVLAGHAGRWPFVLALVLLFAQPIARTSKVALLGRQPHAANLTEDGGEVFVAPEATLDRRLPAGAQVDGRTVVSPPCFSWQQRRLQRGEGYRK